MNKLSKKITSLLIINLIISSLIGGCVKKQTEKVYEQNNEKNIIEETTISQQIENVRYAENIPQPQRIDLNEYSTNIDKSYLIDRGKKITLNINGETKTLTFEDLAKQVNEILNRQYKDFKINEHLLYNYIHITNKQTTGIYLDDSTEEIRQNLQYYKDIKRKVGNNTFNREILAVKYKNRANDEYYIGKFFTKQENKPVELEWVEGNLDNEESQNLSNIKHINLSGITDFYEFNSINDFKAIGKMSLKQWKNEVLSTNNSGIETLKNVEAKPKMESTDKGKTVEKSMTIRPLEFTFDYTITVKDNMVTFEADLTDTLTSYYKLFKNYDIDKCNYNLTIEEIQSNNDINELFNDDSIHTSTDSNIATQSDIEEEIDEEATK